MLRIGFSEWEAISLNVFEGGDIFRKLRIALLNIVMPSEGV